MYCYSTFPSKYPRMLLPKYCLYQQHYFQSTLQSMCYYFRHYQDQPLFRQSCLKNPHLVPHTFLILYSGYQHY
ncbi:hypothetical protein PBCV1_a542R [Paramecium bursaria Chlorella virus 1]|uniref:Uncharacterized protein n=1 Tax=Paramecium bursaria Chlorella virus 1 TaxID=10506 RepID=O41024_PBCV1|nr:hypothetical protein PBCV1_a542R [Paramecium bursaria Chlorella virus 1]AAC96993.1 hypothetical protein [Paramecium bursaria Chlorella virus 1]